MKRPKKNTVQKPAEKEQKIIPGGDWLIPEIAVAAVTAIAAYFLLNRFYSLHQDRIEYIFRFLSLVEFPGAVFSSVIKRLLLNLLDIAVAALFACAIFGTGDFVYSCFTGSIDYAEKPLTKYFVFIAGIFPFIIYTFIIGFSGLFYSWALAPLIIPAVTGIIKLKKILKTEYSRFLKEKIGFWGMLTALAIFIIALFNLIGALSPETFYDSCVYHLGLPQNWVNRHRIFMDTYISASYYPLTLSHIYAGIMLVRDATAAKVFSYLLTLFSLFAVIDYFSEKFGREKAYLAGLILYSCPYLMMLSWKSSTENGTVLFETLAIMGLLAAYESFLGQKPAPAPDTTPVNGTKTTLTYFLLSAYATGLAFGSKYTSGKTIAAACAAVFLLLLFNYFKGKAQVGASLGLSLKKVILVPLVYFSVSMATASPWLIRNFVSVGNPVYPFLRDKIGKIKLEPVNFEGDVLQIKPTLKNIILTPYYLTMGGFEEKNAQGKMERKELQESYPGPAFIVLLVPFLLLLKRPAGAGLIFIYSLAYFLMWFFTATYFRLSVASVFAAVYLLTVPIFAFSNKVVFRIIQAVLLFISMKNLAFASIMLKINQNPLGVVTGLQDYSEYLAMQRPSFPLPPFEAYFWMNENLPKDAAVMVTGECRGIYLKRPFVTNMLSNPTPFVEIVNNAESAEEIYSRMKALGLTHLFLNLPEGKRLPMLFYFKKEKEEIFNGFWARYVRLVHEKDWRFVFELGDTGIEDKKMKNIYIEYFGLN